MADIFDKKKKLEPPPPSKQAPTLSEEVSFKAVRGRRNDRVLHNTTSAVVHRRGSTTTTLPPLQCSRLVAPAQRSTRGNRPAQGAPTGKAHLRTTRSRQNTACKTALWDQFGYQSAVFTCGILTDPGGTQGAPTGRCTCAGSIRPGGAPQQRRWTYWRCLPLVGATSPACGRAWQKKKKTGLVRLLIVHF